MKIVIKKLENEKCGWDEYVKKHKQPTLYQLSGWKEVIEKAYGHKAYYLIALRENQTSRTEEFQFCECVDANTDFKPTQVNRKIVTQNIGNVYNIAKNASASSTTSIAGVLPLVHIKHLFFGNQLISIPFFDYGGVLADNVMIEKALLGEAIRIAGRIGAGAIEIRNLEGLKNDSIPNMTDEKIMANSCNTEISNNMFDTNVKHGRLKEIKTLTLSNKVRMVLELPNSSAELMRSFKSKLRSQINRPVKMGLRTRIGGVELLDDFYHVFASNMRDLGSPVHSKKFMSKVLEVFSNNAKVFVVYLKQKPVAGSFVFGNGETLGNPWASALRKYSKIAPNMLLYWSMLEYACDLNFKYFDFGRSNKNEGTYKFKKQWGANPQPLQWHFIPTSQRVTKGVSSNSKTYKMAGFFWKKIPVSAATFLGPSIRKYISL